MDESTKLLIELREAYVYNVCELGTGEPKMEFMELCDLWQRVGNRIDEIQNL